MPQLLETLEKNMKGEVIGGEVPLRENGFEKVDVPVVNKCNCDMNRRGSVTFNTKAEKEPNGKQNGTVFSEPPGDSNTEETGCKLCLSQCRVACIPCRANLHKPDRDSKDRKERLKYAFMCPPHGPVAKWITLGTIALLTWAVCWSILGDDVMPGGNIFGIVILFIASTIGGYLAQIIKLPPLLGMLLVGVLLGNVPHIDVGRDIKDSWSSALRKMALVIILIRAGLGLDVDALLKLKFVIIRLAFLPCLIEATAIAVSARYILDFPWVFAFMLGFVIAAVSAAVAIPFMLQFQAEGYGVEKGVPTLVMACASIDNVLAITCFSIVLGIGFAKGDLAMTIAKGPLQIIVALVLGVIAGLFLWYFPHKRSPNKAIYRFLILFGICLLAVFGSSVADWSSSGPLGVLITALVAAYKWRKQGWKGKENPLAAVFGHLWTIFQILLFGLVGALVEIRLLDWTTVALGVAVIAIGLCFRLLVAYLALLTTVFNVKERVFVLFSWLPKATVQAAIGSMVFDRAMAEKADPDVVKYGLTILMLGVVSIILTSPIGALLVAVSGPKLLSKTSYDMEANVSEEEDSENDQNNEGAQTGDSGIVNAAFVSDADHNSNVGVPTVAVIGGTTDPAPSQTAESTTRL